MANLVPAVAPLIFLSIFLFFIAYSIYCSRRLYKKLAQVVELLGVSSVKRKFNKVIGSWNGLEVTFYFPGLNSLDTSKMRGQTVVQIKVNGIPRFYLQNRFMPPITRSLQWSLFNYLTWRPTSIELRNEDDRAMFAAFGKDPEPIHKLLDFPASRMLIVKNLIDGDGELFYEARRLSVLRTTRARFSPKDSASFELFERILREEWDLLRTATSVLLPLELEVSERQALALYCPFCRSELKDLGSLTRCSECKTLHHTACWNENGRCSVFGCKGMPTSYFKQSQTTIPSR